jgi:hypothetical protein
LKDNIAQDIEATATGATRCLPEVKGREKNRVARKDHGLAWHIDT